jgi:cation transport ATPase
MKSYGYVVNAQKSSQRKSTSKNTTPLMIAMMMKIHIKNNAYIRDRKKQNKKTKSKKQKAKQKAKKQNKKKKKKLLFLPLFLSSLFVTHFSILSLISFRQSGIQVFHMNNMRYLFCIGIPVCQHRRMQRLELPLKNGGSYGQCPLKIEILLSSL